MDFRLTLTLYDVWSNPEMAENTRFHTFPLFEHFLSSSFLKKSLIPKIKGCFIVKLIQLHSFLSIAFEFE